MTDWTVGYSKGSLDRIREYDRNRNRYPPRTGLKIPDLENLPIGGSRVFHLAVLSIDIRGFTNISINYGEGRIEALARLQSLYLSEMSRVIRDYNGVTEKYTGDGVLGLFGTEYDTNASSDVQNAISCALTVKLILKNSLNPYLKSTGLTEINVGMGMDYGTVIIEKVGLRGDNQFSLAGTSVSLASKMQSFAEPGQIIIGDEVKKRLVNERMQFVKAYQINWGYNYKTYLYDARWEE